MTRRAESMVAEAQSQEAPAYLQAGGGDAPSTNDIDDDQSYDLVKPRFSLDIEDKEAGSGDQGEAVKNENANNEGGKKMQMNPVQNYHSWHLYLSQFLKTGSQSMTNLSASLPYSFHTWGPT